MKRLLISLLLCVSMFAQSGGNCVTFVNGVATYAPCISNNHVVYMMEGPFSVAAATTVFVGPGGTTSNAGENTRQMVMPDTCTAGNLFFLATVSQTASGSLVATLRRSIQGAAASDTTVVVTMAAGAAAGIYSDTTHTQSFQKGDLISVKFVNNSGTTTSASITSVSLTCSY